MDQEQLKFRNQPTQTRWLVTPSGWQRTIHALSETNLQPTADVKTHPKLKDVKIRNIYDLKSMKYDREINKSIEETRKPRKRARSTVHWYGLLACMRPYNSKA